MRRMYERRPSGRRARENQHEEHVRRRRRAGGEKGKEGPAHLEGRERRSPNLYILPLRLRGRRGQRAWRWMGDDDDEEEPQEEVLDEVGTAFSTATRSGLVGSAAAVSERRSCRYRVSAAGARSA